MKKRVLAFALSTVILVGNVESVVAVAFPYKVEKNDNLWEISKKFQVDVNDVVRINNIKNPDLIYIDQILEIPSNTDNKDVTIESDEVNNIKQIMKEKIDTNFTKDIMFTISDHGDDPITGNRSAGSDAERQVSEYIYRKMQEIGLSNVTTDPITVDGWTFKGANITLKDNGKDEVIHLGGYATQLSAKDEKIAIVYANEGTAKDLEGMDIEGKLVLIDIDQGENWWINWPAYEAHIKGARGVIAVNTGSYAQYDNDTLGSQDICGPEDAPALAISVNGANKIKELIKASGNGEIEVMFNAESIVTRNAKSQNIWGEIPGKTDEVIYYIAHYDGYYHSAFDDASGVATILSIAKIMVESGYQPDKTIRFVTHGAEEWGKIDSAYDWGIGAYNQIMVNHPEWAESAFAMINVDGCYPLEDETVVAIRSNYEMDTFADEYIKNTEKNDKFKVYNNSPTSTGTEDFIYSLNGIPVITAVSFHDESTSVYREGAYHSSADNKKLGFNHEYSEYTTRFFAEMAYELDTLAVKPLDFTTHFKVILDSIDSDYAPVSFSAELNKAYTVSLDLTKEIDNLNKEYKLAIAENNTEKADKIKVKARGLNKSLYEIFKEVQKDFIRLGWAENIIQPHVNYQGNVKVLKQSIELLKEGKSLEVLDDNLYKIDYNWYAYHFSKEAYDYFTAQYRENAKATFGEGLVEKPNEDLFDLIKGLKEKVENKDTNYDKEIEILEKALKTQEGYLNEIYKKEEGDIIKINEKIEGLLKTIS